MNICLLWLGAVIALPLFQNILVAQNSDELMIDNVTVIPMTGSGPLENQTVTVADGRIKFVGEDSRSLDADSNVIDGTGKFLIPGLWDTHVHVNRDDEMMFMVVNGVTTAVNLHGSPEHLQLRADLESGRKFGPRLLTTGPIIVGDAMDAGTVTAIVNEHADAGYDGFKIYADWQADAYFAAADAADSRDFLFIGHVPRNQDLDMVLDDGRQGIVHLEEIVYTTRMDDWLQKWRDKEEPTEADAPELMLADEVRRVAKKLIDKEVWVVATHIVIDNYMRRSTEEGRNYLAHRDFMRYVDPLTKWTWAVGDQSDRRIRHEQHTLLQEYILQVFSETGVKMALGTDAGLDQDLQVMPGWAVHEELGIMVKAGYSPHEALRQATVHAAEFMQRPNEGVIAEGARADLVLLNSNPLDDISNARDIEGVMVNGRWHHKGEFQRRLADLEAGHTALEKEVARLDAVFENDLMALTTVYREIDEPTEPIARYVEQRVNVTGYEILGRKEYNRAIEVFRMNVDLFPESANVYDSLAEAYLGNGQKDEAVTWYKRALEVDPAFNNAKMMLERIEKMD